MNQRYLSRIVCCAIDGTGTDIRDQAQAKRLAIMLRLIVTLRDTTILWVDAVD